MSSSDQVQAIAPGDRTIVGRYFEEARKVHAVRLAKEPVSLGDQPERLADAVSALDSKSMESLIEPYLFYVVQVASEFNRRDVSFADLLAEGNMGLVEAAGHYDPKHEVKFLTYATWWIRKRILEYLVAEGKTVRLTRHAREKRRELSAVQDALKEKLGREPSVEELEEATGFERRTLVDLMSAAPTTVSIEKQVVQDVGIAIKETLIAPSKTPEEELVSRLMAQIVKEEVARLPQREREIIENRFSLNGEAPLTFQEIGEQFGLSRERARQIEQQALERLRKRIHRRISVQELPDRPAKRIRRRARRRAQA